MDRSSTDRYLETEVLTAPPQKLHLMLIEAAIRSIERARQQMQAEQHGKATDALIHAQQVVTEMLSGLNREIDAPLARKVASVYLFVFRSLVDASLNRDLKRLDEALRILRIEQETWREVCSGGKESATTEHPSHAALLRGPSSPPLPLPGDDPLGGPSDTGSISSGFSLEA